MNWIRTDELPLDIIFSFNVGEDIEEFEVFIRSLSGIPYYVGLIVKKS